MSWLRRPSLAEGRSEGISSGKADSGEGISVFGGFGGGGLGESTYCRVWMRILHCIQVEARKEERLEIRIACEAEEDGKESKKSLGTIRASGCMAVLLRRRLGELRELQLEPFLRLGFESFEFCRVRSPLTALNEG